MKHKFFYHSSSAPSLMLNVFLSGGLARFSYYFFRRVRRDSRDAKNYFHFHFLALPPYPSAPFLHIPPSWPWPFSAATRWYDFRIFFRQWRQVIVVASRERSLFERWDGKIWINFLSPAEPLRWMRERESRVRRKAIQFLSRKCVRRKFKYILCRYLVRRSSKNDGEESFYLSFRDFRSLQSRKILHVHISLFFLWLEVSAGCMWDVELLIQRQRHPPRKLFDDIRRQLLHYFCLIKKTAEKIAF